jgi:hypothetical protein
MLYYLLIITTFSITLAFNNSQHIKQYMLWSWGQQTDKSREHSRNWHIATSLIVVLFVVGVSLHWHWIYIFSGLATHWIVFDLALNRFMGWRWYYYGKTSEIDKRMNKLHPLTAIAVKLAVWGIGVSLVNLI